MKLLYRFILILLLTCSTIGVFSQDTITSSPDFEDGTLRRIRVPILMYHYVGDLPEDADEIRIDLTLSTDIFRQHLEYLCRENYTTITLYDLDRALSTGDPLPSNPVILTFDDGYLDHYTNAFPALQDYGFTGTFFVITNFADAGNPNHLSWQQIAEMATAGMNMESHTKSHANLVDRTHDFLVFEVMGSIESLQHFTSNQPKMFAYPAGTYDEGALEFLEITPISRAVTTQFGFYHTSDNAFELPRLRINNKTGVPGLELLLNSDQ